MSTGNHSDNGWVEGLRNRSHTVFEALFRRCYPAAYRFAYSCLMNRSVAEDVVQDVFASLWRNGGSLPDGVDIQSYIHTAVKNACFDHLRHLRVVDSNRDKLVEALVFSGNVEYEDDRELHERVAACLEVLPEQQRNILRLKITEGLGYREIAARMNISEATVHTHIKRAYRTIRKRLPMLSMLMRIWGVM